MGEQDMRACVEGHFRRRLRQMVMPLALGVGLALTSPCGHGPPQEDPALASQPDGTEPGYLSGPEVMDFSSEPKPYADSPAQRRVYRSASEIARAVERCDRPFLLNAILSHSEMVSLTAGVPLDASTYANVVEQWIAATVGQFCAPPEPGVSWQIGNLLIKDLVTVPAGTQWRQPLAVVRVPWNAYVEYGAQRSIAPKDIAPLVLTNFHGRWRILVKGR